MNAATTFGIIATLLANPAFGADAARDPLADMSLEDLLGSPVAVSSVARRPGSVQQSPAAVTVISREEIRRSGATNIPELLRLVPGMEVARVDSHQWAISTRGFNDLFANKLLVMMDGRSVYASLFSGTFWDVQDVLIEDLERIEAVRGPGASLWGANAVNGVVNILSKRAASTQGLLLSQGAGNEERAFGAIRYGGRLGEHLHYRVFAKYAAHDDSAVLDTGFPETLIRINAGGGTGGVGSAASPPRVAHDAWSLAHVGFRADWEPPGADRLTLQGDLYRGREQQLYQRLTPGSFSSFYEQVTDAVSGGNVLARWTHTFSNRSEFILQSYYDRTERELAVLGEARDTFDVDFQHQFALGRRHTLLWGAGYRRISDTVDNSIEVALSPVARVTNLFSAFAQDEIVLLEKKLALTLGSKFEHNDFTGTEVQPNARLLFTCDPRNTIWAAVSRAVRTPSRADDDFRLTYPGVPSNVVFPGAPAITLAVDGNRRFAAEKLTAFELGYRGDVTKRLGLDLALYYNEYRRLRGVVVTNANLDFTQSPAEIGVSFDNEPSADTRGGEVGANLRVTERWRLRADYSLLRMRVTSRSSVRLGSFGADALSGSSPQQQVGVRSWLDLPRAFEFDTAARWVDELPALGIPAYFTLDVRVGWRPTQNLEISVAAQNLLDRRHPEFKPSYFLSQATEVQRSVHARVTLRF
jgi:iron complex outermembrane recepter protein